LTKNARAEFPMSHQMNPGLVSIIPAVTARAVGSIIIVMGTNSMMQTVDM
jgi:hypothetical protein